MLLQDDKASCGAVALVNGLKALGHTLSVTAACRLAGTTATYGTRPKGLMEAIISLDFVPVLLHESQFAQAWTKLRGHLALGVPVLLLVDDESHWVAAIGVLGDRVLVADSAETKLVGSMDWKALQARWEAHGKRRPYFGLAIGGPGPGD